MITVYSITLMAIRMMENMQKVVDEISGMALENITPAIMQSLDRMKDAYNALVDLCAAYTGNYRNIAVYFNGEFALVRNLIERVYIFSLKVEALWNYKLGLSQFA